MSCWIFLRHGESEANRARRFSGHQDVPLTPEGRRQAITAGPLINQILDGEALATVWSSDLQRARETAACALESANINLPIFEHNALRERCLGDWEGKDIDPIKNSSESTRLLSWNEPAPGGESLADVARRAVNVLTTIPHNGPTLIVAHGGLIRALIGLLDHTQFEEIGRVNIPNAIPIARDISPERWNEIADQLSG